MSLTGLILAAGNGKRMQSTNPKVLHELGGKPMLEWVLQALKQLPCQQLCVVLGPQHEPFASLLNHYPTLAACIQKEANGTAGAVAAAAPFLGGDYSQIPYAHGEPLRGTIARSESVLICAGDTPGLDAAMLRAFVQDAQRKKSKLAVLGMQVPNPTGYGRLLLSEDKKKLLRIIEERDTDERQKKITLCNSGIIFAEPEHLLTLLRKIQNRNAQKEFYLTDCIELSVQQGILADVFITENWESLQGVNDRQQLETMEAWIQAKHRMKE